MKCRSISTCFVRSCCNTRLWAISIAVFLSQWSFIAPLSLNPRSLNNFFNHNNSQSSTSTLDPATTFYFLPIQVTRLLPTKVKYLDVERRLVIEPTNLHMYTFLHSNGHSWRNQASIKSHLQVSQNTDYCIYMSFSRRVHKLTYYINCISDDRVSVRQLN